MKKYTDVTVLLDRSGSMESIRGAMEESYNTFIAKHREVPSTRISLIQFDDRNPQQVMYSNVPIKAAEKLVLKPRGNTPLLDALCTAIDNTGARFGAMDESDRPDQVLFVIITDGEENASIRHSRTDVHNRITHQSDRYQWQFVYMGANQDALREALSFGINPAWAMNFAATSKGIGSASGSLASNTYNYTSNTSRSRGTAASANLLKFNDDQRSDAEITTVTP